RAAAVMASSAFHGSATPSPFASTPQRSQVEGMNCIQPIAPAELGPMLRPKFDSTLLMAASTCQGTPYPVPARCQIPSRAGSARPGELCGSAGAAGSVRPGALGTCALASGVSIGVDGTTAKTGEPAPAAPPAPPSAATSTASRESFLIRRRPVG